MVQHLARAGARQAVELGGVAQQLQQGRERGVAFVEVRRGQLVELALYLGPLFAPLAHLGREPVRGPLRVADQFQQCVYLRVEHTELFRQRRAHQAVGCFAVGDGRAHGRGDLLAQVARERDAGVVVFDCALDLIDLQIGQVAGVFLAAGAHEVEVDFAGLGLAGHVPDAVSAACAPDRALEIVVVAPLAGAFTAAAFRDDLLHSVE